MLRPLWLTARGGGGGAVPLCQHGGREVNGGTRASGLRSSSGQGEKCLERRVSAEEGAGLA